jgi:hypothetical protein
MAQQKRKAGGGGGIALSRRAAILAVGGVLAVIAVLVVIRVVGGGNSSSSTTDTGTTSTAASTQDAATIEKAVQSIPAATLAKAGDGGQGPLPRIPGPSATIKADGKPLFFYVGGEFCPYCAAERWAMVNALGRFGTLTGLGLTSSSSTDVFPDTPTFTFHGSTYDSSHVTLQAVEVRDREGKPLETLTPTQQALESKYNSPPYVPAPGGGIPFLLIGGRYLLVGSQFSPQILAGKTHSQIAAAMADPSTPESRSILGAANWLTAAICELTAGKPATACDSAVVKSLRRRQTQQ